jgi:hypothetical protein
MSTDGGLFTTKHMARQSRNQTQPPDFYRRFRRFYLDKTKGPDDRWLGSAPLDGGMWVWIPYLRKSASSAVKILAAWSALPEILFEMRDPLTLSYGSRS